MNYDVNVLVTYLDIYWLMVTMTTQKQVTRILASMFLIALSKSAQALQSLASVRIIRLLLQLLNCFR